MKVLTHQDNSKDPPPPFSERKFEFFAPWNLLCWSQNVHVMYKMCVISQNSRRKASVEDESSNVLEYCTVCTTPWDRWPGHQKKMYLLKVKQAAANFFAAKVQISASESDQCT